MIFSILGQGSGKYKKYVIKEQNTKSIVCLDIGLALEFKDKRRAEVITDLLNNEFGRKR